MLLVHQMRFLRRFTIVRTHCFTHRVSKDLAGQLLKHRLAVVRSYPAPPVQWRTLRAPAPCCASRMMKKVLSPTYCGLLTPKNANTGALRRSRMRNDFPLAV